MLPIGGALRASADAHVVVGDEDRSLELRVAERVGEAQHRHHILQTAEPRLLEGLDEVVVRMDAAWDQIAEGVGASGAGQGTERQLPAGQRRASGVPSLMAAGRPAAACRRCSSARLAKSSLPDGLPGAAAPLGPPGGLPDLSTVGAPPPRPKGAIGALCRSPCSERGHSPAKHTANRQTIAKRCILPACCVGAIAVDRDF